MKTRLSHLFSLLTAVSLSAGSALQSHAQDGSFTRVGVTLQTSAESPLAGVYIHGDYAFVGGTSIGYRSSKNLGVRIVDLSDPGNPELVARIPLRKQGKFANHTHGDAVVTHLSTDDFRGDVAIILNGVPDSFTPADYPRPYGIWDVTDPTHPEFLSILDIGYSSGGREGGDLSDKPNDAEAVAGNYFYAIYDVTASCLSIGSQNQCAGPGDATDTHMAVVDIADPRNPVVVGEWQDELKVLLEGLTLNEQATRAYLTGISPFPYGHFAREGYLYILDIQDPAQPIEIGRYIMPLNDTTSMFTAVPTSDGAHVILADGSWGLKSSSSGCGTLHILDISDPAAIHEISEFALSESSSPNKCGRDPWIFATDVAVRGNTVYSTWMGGGVRAIDISDPANPVEVGQFLPTGGPLSDVALLGDHYVVATTVWGPGLYILRDSSPIPTSIEAATAVPAQYALGQNYPNPFNPQTAIQYDLPVQSHVKLSVFNLMGQQVATLVEGVREAGAYTVRWDGRDRDGRELAGGVYLYRLRTGDGKRVETRKLVLVR